VSAEKAEGGTGELAASAWDCANRQEGESSFTAKPSEKTGELRSEPECGERSKRAQRFSAEPSKQGAVLIVGLGNPGIEYQFTPHNSGFLAIDRLAEQCGVAVTNRRCRSLTATAQIAGRQVILAKPETYMNLSGLAVEQLLQEFGLTPQGGLIVIYDEIDLPLGTLRVRERGSAGGHNGVKSISGALETEEWLRIRIGVAPAQEEAAVRARSTRKEYVLAPWRKAQLVILDEVLDRVARAVETVLTKGPGAAMNEFNGRGPDEAA
jgi:peptidyl-tRNA hydrolase, PTH1 family